MLLSDTQKGSLTVLSRESTSSVPHPYVPNGLWLAIEQHCSLSYFDIRNF
nr:MAG TPA_asm: hypothetical protein [Caudoviricetes sp.]